MWGSLRGFWSRRVISSFSCFNQIHFFFIPWLLVSFFFFLYFLPSLCDLHLFVPFTSTSSPLLSSLCHSLANTTTFYWQRGPKRLKAARVLFVIIQHSTAVAKSAQRWFISRFRKERARAKFKKRLNERVHAYGILSWTRQSNLLFLKNCFVPVSLSADIFLIPVFLVFLNCWCFSVISLRLLRQNWQFFSDWGQRDENKHL